MRNAQFPGHLTSAQNLQGRRALARVSRVTAVDQNVSVDEGNHGVSHDHRYTSLRASSHGSRASAVCLWLSPHAVGRPGARPAISYWHRTEPAVPRSSTRARLWLCGGLVRLEYCRPRESTPVRRRGGCRTGRQWPWGRSTAAWRSPWAYPYFIKDCILTARKSCCSLLLELRTSCETRRAATE